MAEYLVDRQACAWPLAILQCTLAMPMLVAAIFSCEQNLSLGNITVNKSDAASICGNAINYSWSVSMDTI